MINKHVVKFNIKGNRSQPDTIALSELANLLKYLEMAIKAAVSPVERVAHAEEKDPLVSLVSLHEGNSSDMGMAVLDYGLPAVSDISRAIASDAYSTMPSDCHVGLYNIFKWISKRRFQLEIEEDRRFNIEHAVISRKRPVPPPLSSAFTVSGMTTAWGYLMRAGGKKPRAALLFPDNRKVTINADEALTKELGARLYENVGIEGVATWRVRDWRMLSFRATRVLEYRPQATNLVQTFRDLADASKGRWDDIDAEDYVRELRGYSREPESEGQQ